MDAMLKRFCPAVLVAVLLVCLFPAGSAAGQATFISGEAANSLLSSYRALAARHVIAPLGPDASSLAITIQETADGFSIQFGASDARSSSSEKRETVTNARSATSRASFSSLESGTKTVGPAATSALLSVLDFAEHHPAGSDAVRNDAAAGTYILEVFEPGTTSIFVSMSYPGSSSLGRTSIGCNPQRQFRYDVMTSAIAEIPKPCS